MARQDTIGNLQQGWDLLFQQAGIIALLPLEEWLSSLEKAEEAAPFIDPTLYRNYIYDPEKKGESIKSVIRAAIALKKEICSLQERYGGSLAR